MAKKKRWQNTKHRMLIHIACICVHMNKNFNFGSYKRNIMTREVGGGYVTSALFAMLLKKMEFNTFSVIVNVVIFQEFL